MYDERLDKVWAAKKVKRTSVKTEERLLGKVDGSLFPRIVDVVEQADGKYLIMDWIEGETLQQRLAKSGPFLPDEAVRIGLMLCRALKALHQMQPPCLYLDCKPSNVMLDKDGRLWLIDFGSAVELGGYEAIPLSASPGYGAPEQFILDEKLRRVDVRSDVFGLGMTLYALLGGLNPAKPPYGACRLSQCRPDVPEKLQEIVEKCICKNPAERYQTIGALEKALEDILTEKKKIPLVRYAVYAGTAVMIGMLIWRAGVFFCAVQDVGADIREKISAFAILVVTAFLSVLWERAAAFFQGKAVPVYEPLQSVLRTEKRPGKWMFMTLIFLLFLGSFRPAASVEASEATCSGSPVILRDANMRKLLVKKGTALRTSEPVYLEISPELFTGEEELNFCVTATGADSGRKYVYELRYCPGE